MLPHQIKVSHHPTHPTKKLFILVNKEKFNSYIQYLDYLMAFNCLIAFSVHLCLAWNTSQHICVCQILALSDVRYLSAYLYMKSQSPYMPNDNIGLMYNRHQYRCFIGNTIFTSTESIWFPCLLWNTTPQVRSYRWVNARKTELQCISNGVTSFLH